jgi:hypothetical protein
MSLEKCTNPNAPFYQADLTLLNFLETHNIDMPCDLLGAALAGTMGFGFLLTISTFVIVMHLTYVFLRQSIK